MRVLIVAMLLIVAGCGTRSQFACSMEAKVCPDGSYVGRDPANHCQFRPCAK